MSTSGYFLIKSKLNGRVLDISGSNPNPETNIILFINNKGSNQQWTINEQGVIISKLNDLAIDISQSEDKMVAVTNTVTGEKTQQWTITDQGVIINQDNGLALEASTILFGRASLSSIQEGQLSQQWELVPVTDEPTPPPPPTNCEELANTLQSCLPEFTNAVSQVTTNELDVTGTKLTSTVNGQADTVNLSDAVSQATTNKLDVTGTRLTSTVNGQADTVNLSDAVSQATTNKLDVTGTKLTSTVNGQADTVNLSDAVSQATTNKLDVTGTKLTSTVNGQADDVNLSGAVIQATTNTLALDGSELISTVNGKPSSVDLAPLIGNKQRFWFSKIKGETKTRSREWTQIATLDYITITLNTSSQVLITLNSSAIHTSPKAATVWLSVRIYKQPGVDIQGPVGGYTPTNANQFFTITVSTVLELSAGTYNIIPDWLIDGDGTAEATIGEGHSSTILTVQAF
ncbi:hypothetical protein NIES4103_32330 [Nostoc sp. NIES-4103]|nr:hypothetical protein NIES4103_32330 [Nostoc sp. NIES-4103]